MTNVVPIRAGLTKSEIEFCKRIDALVAKFNEIANQEILKPQKPLVKITDLEGLLAANKEAAQSFQEDLKKTTLPNKIESLKEAFGQIADLAMEALRDLEMQSLSIDEAISRITHVLDVMNDDDSDYAPELVRSDAICNDMQWAPLLEHRNQISNDLRAHLDGLYKLSL